MPRISKEKAQPQTIEPANWREQVAKVIERDFHASRGDGDEGLAKPALKMLRLAKMDEVVKHLVRLNK